jgi:hypothetical protein
MLFRCFVVCKNEDGEGERGAGESRSLGGRNESREIKQTSESVMLRLTFHFRGSYTRCLKDLENALEISNLTLVV